jgi:hypothetical protein
VLKELIGVRFVIELGSEDDAKLQHVEHHEFARDDLSFGEPGSHLS